MHVTYVLLCILLLFNKLSYMRLSSAIPHLSGNSWNFAPVLKNICIRLVSGIAPITMIAHSAVCINLLSFCHSLISTLTPTHKMHRVEQISTSRRNCEIRCLETSRRLSQFVGEEIYNVVPFFLYFGALRWLQYPNQHWGRGKSHKCFKICDEYCSLRTRKKSALLHSMFC